MRTTLFALPALLLLLLLGIAGDAHAHIGDEIYPFYELLDEDLHRIDLTDGSVEDWHDVLGEPSLTGTDFYYPNSHYDPSNVDNRFWLGWHRRSGTLWVAMERFDDIYHNNYAGELNESGLPAMNRWDSSFSFMVDGDHSGGRYLFGHHSCDGCTVEEIKLQNIRQAQHWMAIAQTAAGQHVAYDGASEWAVREPYAAAGGGGLGNTPTTSVTELKVTPSTTSSTTTRPLPKPRDCIRGRSSASASTRSTTTPPSTLTDWGLQTFSGWATGAGPTNSPISSSTACWSAPGKTPPATTMSPPSSRPPGGGSRPASSSRPGAGPILPPPDPRSTHGAQSSPTIALAETRPSSGTRNVTAPHSSVR